MPFVIPAIAAAATWVGGVAGATATALGAGTAATAAVAMGATTIASSIITGAIYGAVSGAVIGGGMAAIKGGDIGKGALNGAMYGAAGGAILGAVSGIYGAATGGTASGAAGGTTEGLINSTANTTNVTAGLEAAGSMSPEATGIIATTPAANAPNAGGSLAGGGGEIINKNMQNKVETPPPAPSFFEKNPAATTVLGSGLMGVGQGMMKDDEAIAKKNRQAAMELAQYQNATKQISLTNNSLRTPLPYTANKFTEQFKGGTA